MTPASEVNLAVYHKLFPEFNILKYSILVFIVAKMRLVLCDKAEKAQAMLNEIEKTPSLKYIVVFEPLSNNNLETAQKHGVTVMSLVQLEDEGRANLLDPKVSLCSFNKM